MNHEQYPNDGNTLTQELRDALTAVAAPERPPLAVIANRGRARQRRRLAGFAGLGGAGAAAGAAGAALALGVTGVLGAAPAGSAGATGTPTAAPAHNSTGTIRTAEFTLTSNANGTDTLTLRLTMRQMFDPTVLQRALAQDGIPALVKTGIYCSSSPAPPDPNSIGVLTAEFPNGTPLKPSSPVKPPAGFKPLDTVTVINPAAMPSGTKLFFGYASSSLLFSDLIYASSYTCGSQPPVTP
jgi:hypothetical protein